MLSRASSIRLLSPARICSLPITCSHRLNTNSALATWGGIFVALSYLKSSGLKCVALSTEIFTTRRPIPARGARTHFLDHDIETCFCEVQVQHMISNLTNIDLPAVLGGSDNHCIAVHKASAQPDDEIAGHGVSAVTNAARCENFFAY